jgi:hypothetical protein
MRVVGGERYALVVVRIGDIIIVKRVQADQ